MSKSSAFAMKKSQFYVGTPYWEYTKDLVRTYGAGLADRPEALANILAEANLTAKEVPADMIRAAEEVLGETQSIKSAVREKLAEHGKKPKKAFSVKLSEKSEKSPVQQPTGDDNTTVGRDDNQTQNEEEEDMIKLQEKAVREMFDAMGLPGADWTTKRLLQKAEQLNELAADGTANEISPKNKAALKTFRVISQALEAGKKLGFIVDTPAAPEKEKPASKPEGKGKTAKEKPAKESQPRRPRGVTLLDYPATRVLHWMGKNNWTMDEVKKVFASYNITELKESTLRTGWTDGKNPKYSKPAELTSADEKKLAKAAGRK